MRAVILAGGRGRRLAPYTTVLPKPLMPIGEVPILEIVLHQLLRAGCTGITMAVGHLAELLMAYFGDGTKFGLPITYSKEEAPLGTAGPLALIPDLTEPFLVMNGDLLTTLDYRAMYDSHCACRAMVTMAVFPRHVKIDLGVIDFDESRRVRGYTEKPTYDYQVSTGIYVFDPRVLRYIPAGRRLDMPDLVLRLLEAGEEVMAYPFEGSWLDIGRPDDYEQAVAEFERRRAEFLPE